MAETVIKNSELFEPNVLKPTIDEFNQLLKVVKDTESSLKSLAPALQKGLKVPKDSKGLEKLAEDTKKINDIEKGFIETQKAELKIQKDLEKARLSEIKLQQEREKAFDKAAKASAKDFEQHKRNNSVYFQSVDRLRELKRELKELEITGRTNGKLYKSLGQEFVVLNGKVRDAEEGVGEFQRNVGNYRQQLVQLKKELATLDPGSKKFEETAKKAGQLQDSINDAKEATKAFATESKFQTTRTLFGQIGSDLLQLDFKGASDKARQLLLVTRSITFSEALTGVKQLGSTLLNLGKALLTNPLFLIGGTLAAIGVAIFKLKDNVKIIGDAFDFLGKIVRDLKQGFKDLSDEILGTNFALEDKLTKQLSSSEKVLNAVKDNAKFAADLAKAQGKSEEEVAQITIDANNRIIKSYEEATKTYNELLRLNPKAAKAQQEEFDKLQQRAIEADQENRILAEQKKKREKDEAGRRKKELEKIADEEDEFQKRLNKERLEKIGEHNIERLKKEKEFRDELKKIFVASDEELAALDRETQDQFNKKIDDRAEKAKADRKKQKEETIASAKQINNAVFDGLDERSDRIQKQLQEEINQRDNAISEQQQRAAAGLENTLAFEQQKRDEAALALKESEEREAKRKELQELGDVFLSFLQAYSKEDPNNAASKAFAQTLVAQGIKKGIASFYVGTEDTGKATQPLDSNGGRLAILHDNERVLTKEQNKMIGAMTNEELARLAYRTNLQAKGEAVSGGDSIVTNLLAAKLDSLERTIRKKKEVSINWDSYGNRVEEVVQDGMKTVYKKVTTGKKRI